MREALDIEEAIELHGAAVWRMCALYLKVLADAQDAYQDVFLKYALADSLQFEGEDHRRAWLLRVASNRCKDMLKAASRKNISLETGSPILDKPAADPLVQPGSAYYEVIEAMRLLDDPPRTPLYLSLVEGYPASQIAQEMSVPVNTVYSWISRGKNQLKEALR